MYTSMYPTMADHAQIEVRPQPGRQEQFLSSPADIVIYGGAAGGGKTWGLLLDPLRDVDVADFNAVIFRRTYAEVNNPGGLWDESEKLYRFVRGDGVRGDLIWRFPSGANVGFGYCHTDSDLYKWDGAQICDLMFDQLEHFSEKMFWYLQMRNRSMCGIPPRLRATANPPDPSDPGSEWLPQFLSWWIADDGYANLDRAGQIRWMVRWNDEVYWADTRQELIDQFPDQIPQSVTFIPATIYDNQLLMHNNPQYLAKLQALPYIERERFLGDALRGGNWKISAEAGKVFNRDWLEVVSAVPNGGIECKAFDLAATLRSLKNKDPDYTASVKMRKVGNVFYVADVINERYAAGEVDAFIHSTISADLMIARQVATVYRVRWEIEPGSAGLRETERMKRELGKKFPGINADGRPSTGDKIAKSRAFAIAAQQGKVKVLAAAWTDSYLSQLHGFPDRAHDDMVDASAIAYNELMDANSNPIIQKTQPNPWVKVSQI